MPKRAIPTRNQTARTTARVLFDNFFVHYVFLAKLQCKKGANRIKSDKELVHDHGPRTTRITLWVMARWKGLIRRF